MSINLKGIAGVKLLSLMAVVGFMFGLVSYYFKDIEVNSTNDLLKVMKSEYDGKWFENFTFKQLTVRYDKNEKASDTSLWYESVSYPDKFRIDHDISNNNYVIYRNDSAYVFRKDTLLLKTIDPQEHLLLKGGLYFMELEEALAKLNVYGYNIKTFKKSEINNQPVYVVGYSIKQFWVHSTKFYTMRRISKLKDGRKIDVVYDDFVKLNQGWVEQKVTIYLDGQKYQDEFYQDVRALYSTDPRVYNPKVNYKWYQNY